MAMSCNADYETTGELSAVLRADGSWPGDLMTADSEDVQESEAGEIYVKRFKNHEVFVRISVCQRNSKTFQSSTTIINSGEKP